MVMAPHHKYYIQDCGVVGLRKQAIQDWEDALGILTLQHRSIALGIWRWIPYLK